MATFSVRNEISFIPLSVGFGKGTKSHSIQITARPFCGEFYASALTGLLIIFTLNSVSCCGLQGAPGRYDFALESSTVVYLNCAYPFVRHY